ncbi:helix-turn-helix transcriptional regulator [Telluria sp. Tellsp131]
MVRMGSFPKPRQLSDRRVAWLVREIQEWAEARPMLDLPPPPNTSKRKAPVSCSDHVEERATDS